MSRVLKILGYLGKVDVDKLTSCTALASYAVSHSDKADLVCGNSSKV